MQSTWSWTQQAFTPLVLVPGRWFNLFDHHTEAGGRSKRPTSQIVVTGDTDLAPRVEDQPLLSKNGWLNAEAIF